MKIKNRDVIFFAGDSTTDDNKLQTMDGLGHGYVRLVRNALAAFRPREEFTIVNAGVSGNKSGELLERWERDVTACNPNVVFCMIGINDVWRHFDSISGSQYFVSAEEYEKNLEQIESKVKGVREFVWMLPFFMESNRTDAMRRMTDEYAAVMKRVAEKHGRRVLDTQAEFDEYMQSRAGQSISWDRVHPSEIGSMLLARAILREMEVW